MKPTLQVVIGIIQKDDKVLIARKAEDRPEDTGIVNDINKKDFLLGLWHFPGGKLEEGESLEDGVKREVMQETGLEVKVLQKLGERLEERDKVTLHINWFECTYISGEATPGDDIVEVMWVPMKDAQDFCAKKVVDQWPEGVWEKVNKKKRVD